MSNRNKVKFDIRVNGRKGKFWRAVVQEYMNCEFSAGLIKGLEPDTIYLRLDKDGLQPTTIILRPDEAMAIIHVLSGALWSNEMMVADANRPR